MSDIRHYRGRIIQVIEALDYGDAVSNEVIALKKLFLSHFNITSLIVAKYHHPLVRNECIDLEDLQVEEIDIVIYHYAFYAEHTIKIVPYLKCTKVLVYHNITPAQFFAPKTKAYEYCIIAREQLPLLLKHFHHVVGDSQYNIDELIALGFPKEQSSVLPLLIEPRNNKTEKSKPKTSTIRQWLFVSRIAPNKRQDLLIRQFHDYIKQYGGEHRLVLAGRFDSKDIYYHSIVAIIKELNLTSNVLLTGKVSNEEIKQYYQEADVFVCLSEHEGFAVPVVEAAHYEIPVVAVANAAVGETIQAYPGLVQSQEEVIEKVHQFLTDTQYKEAAIKRQLEWVQRFSQPSVIASLEILLKKLIPASDEFKTVSIVICTYNRADMLDRCLDYLQYQTSQAFEVIVVNGPSNDHTLEVIKKYQSKIKVANNPQRNLSVSRNIGIEMASGDIVAFIDDDALPYDDWIELLLKAYNRVPYFVAGIGGPTFFAGSLEFQLQGNIVDCDNNVVETTDKKMIQQPRWFRSLLGTNATFKRNVLLALQGFDEQYDYFLDETDLCVRVQQKGHVLYYDKDLYLRHEFAQSPNRLSKYHYNWSCITKNTIYYVRKFNPLRSHTKNLYRLFKGLYQSRYKYFLSGLKHREITLKQFFTFNAMVARGFKQGWRDANRPRQLRKLEAKPSIFLSYTHHLSYPCVNYEIPRLHIAIVTNEFARFTYNGGIGTMFYHLASELLQMGHYVSVFTPGVKEGLYQRGRFQLYRIPVQHYFYGEPDTTIFTKDLNWSLTAAKAVMEVHGRHKIDIIESALWSVEAYALANAQCGIPVIVRLVTPFKMVDEINEFNTPILDKHLCMQAERNLIQAADAIVPISRSIAKSMEEHYQLMRDENWRQQTIGIAYWPQFEVGHSYQSLSTIDAQLSDIPANAFKFLYLGRLEKRKGIDLFLDAALQVLAIDTYVYFLIAGAGKTPWESYIDERVDPKLRKHFIFMGEIAQENKDKLYAYCDVVVFPSRYESFGLVALEAFVHSKPVIASNCASIPEIVLNNKCGILFEPEKVTELSAAMLQLKNDAKLYASLAVGAKERVYELSGRNMAIQSIKLYADLINVN